MKNYIRREGYLNRHNEPLPNERVVINIAYEDSDGEHKFLCEWKPYDPTEYVDVPPEFRPIKGYLGTAEVISGKHKGIGFHAWDQNDSEFIYYQLTEL